MTEDEKGLTEKELDQMIEELKSVVISVRDQMVSTEIAKTGDEKRFTELFNLLVISQRIVEKAEAWLDDGTMNVESMNVLVDNLRVLGNTAHRVGWKVAYALITKPQSKWSEAMVQPLKASLQCVSAVVIKAEKAE